MEPLVRLEGCKGVRGILHAYMSCDTDNVRKALELGIACTGANDYGAYNKEIKEKVGKRLDYHDPDFCIDEIKTQDEDADDELKEPWFQLEDTYVTESFSLSIG